MSGNNEVINISSSSSSNDLMGIELLMNTEKKTKSSSSNNVNIDFQDLNSLEQELNDLSFTDIGGGGGGGVGGDGFENMNHNFSSGLFGGGGGG